MFLSKNPSCRRQRSLWQAMLICSLMSNKHHGIFPLRILRDGVAKFYNDDGSFMARGLAFSLLIYCIPLALLTVSALSYTIVSSDRALYWVRGLSEALIPQFRDE